MFSIVEKKKFSDKIKLLVVRAPRVARHAKPGQFVMLRTEPEGERIPLTIADSDCEAGTVTIIFQEVGYTTTMLGALEAGEFLEDIVGPLGTPSHLEGIKRACVIGGGLGCAIAYPQAKALSQSGAHVEFIAGFRTRELVFMEDEMRAVSYSYECCTDDGSYGTRGLVTDTLKKRLDSGETYDAVIAIGPLIMMKFVCLTTKPYNVRTTVSMNPLMVDGTGMCGCCRVTVDGQVRFACVDGPDFDGHQVDFDEAMRRSTLYREQEQAHRCRLEGLLHG